ncbi:hypothetical protein D3C77_708100 [compost metagenome]
MYHTSVLVNNVLKTNVGKDLPQRPSVSIRRSIRSTLKLRISFLQIDVRMLGLEFFLQHP